MSTQQNEKSDLTVTVNHDTESDTSSLTGDQDLESDAQVLTWHDNGYYLANKGFTFIYCWYHRGDCM